MLQPPGTGRPIPDVLSASGAPRPCPTVLQTNGCCCGPEKIGPVTGWFFRVRSAVWTACASSVRVGVERVVAQLQPRDHPGEGARSCVEVERAGDVGSVDADRRLRQRHRPRHGHLDERVAARDHRRRARKHLQLEVVRGRRVGGSCCERDGAAAVAARTSRFIAPPSMRTQIRMPTISRRSRRGKSEGWVSGARERAEPRCRGSRAATRAAPAPSGPRRRRASGSAVTLNRATRSGRSSSSTMWSLNVPWLRRRCSTCARKPSTRRQFPERDDVKKTSFGCVTPSRATCAAAVAMPRCVPARHKPLTRASHLYDCAMRRVGITGLGAVTPIGLDAPSIVARRARGRERDRLHPGVRHERVPGPDRRRGQGLRSGDGCASEGGPADGSQRPPRARRRAGGVAGVRARERRSSTDGRRRRLGDRRPAGDRRAALGLARPRPRPGLARSSSRASSSTRRAGRSRSRWGCAGRTTRPCPRARPARMPSARRPRSSSGAMRTSCSPEAPSRASTR